MDYGGWLNETKLIAKQKKKNGIALFDQKY